jgi:hypothetical protein
MQNWKQLTPKQDLAPPVWVNLDNACTITRNGDNTNITFVSVDPVDVKEPADQIVAGMADWRQLSRRGSVFFVNVANASTMVWEPPRVGRRPGMGGPMRSAGFTSITFADRQGGELTVSEEPQHIVAHD